MFVLNTDYKNFAILASCKNNGRTGADENVWILSRQQFLDSKSISTISETLVENKVSMDLLQVTIQDCKFEFKF